MTFWKPCKKLGIAKCQYNPTEGDYYLQANVGDAVHITEEEAEWYRGSLVRDSTIRGIIPKSYLLIRECSIQKIGNIEFLTPKDVPIVQEITATLREWGQILKQLFVYGKEEKYKQIKEIMVELISIRREMLSKKLTNDDFKQKKLQAAEKIDIGNMELNLDLIVRDVSGDELNPETAGAIELFRSHYNTVMCNVRRNTIENNVRASQRHTLNLFVKVTNVVCRVGDEAEVIMALYDVKREKFFSENYVVCLSSKGLPKDLELVNNLRVLFTDLGSKDLRSSREQVCLVCLIVRLGGMFPPPETADQKPPVKKHNLRRPFGVAALHVTDIINGSINPDDDKNHFVPILPCGKSDFLETVIKEAVKAEEVTQRIHKGQGIWLSVKLLDGDLKQVREDYPHLILGHTTVARKMGFPEVIMPSDVRNDFYVTINKGDFGRDSGKLGERNIEITMQVCCRDGTILKDVIIVGGGMEPQSEYRTVVYRHQDSPSWFETFKIAVPIEEFYNCHLKFVFRHRSGNDGKDKVDKEFAIAHVAFISSDQTTLVDGDHNLLVYSIDTKKSTETLAYVSLPSMVSEADKEKDKSSKVISKGPYTLSKKDSFQITTLACSTKLTHNVDLLGLLNWRANPDALPIHLKRLMKVDGEEVIKFLQDTLDALFSILMQNSESDTYDEMVFDALIYVIGLIGDRKYNQFRPVLEVYINEAFSATLAFNKLMVVLKKYIDDVDHAEKQELLYKSLKSIEYLMKLIIRSRVLFAELYDQRGKQQFEISMKQLFHAINGMMCYDKPNTLKVQGAALKYLPLVIPEVITVLDGSEFARLLVQFISNIPKERLSKQKLACILDIVNSPLFTFSEPRQILMHMIIEHVEQEISCQSKDIQICAEIVSNILNNIYNSGSRDDVVLLLAPRDLLRTIIQTIIPMDRSSSLVQDFVTILISILQQMTEEHYTLYMSHFATPIDLLDFLAEISMVFRDLINKCVYPSDWNEMIMIQNVIFLKALRSFSQTIKEKFSAPFEQHQYSLWNNFFHCAISFLTQDALKLENFSLAKRLKMEARYGDMRKQMGSLICSMWRNLGQNKIRFIPDLVGPFLEMTLIPQSDLRRTTLTIFFDMMQCEFYHSGTHGASLNGNFRMFETELITQMDLQVEGGNGDEEYVDLFYAIIHESCSKHQIMRDQGLRFVEVIRNLLNRLLEYRTIIHDENKDSRMSCIVNLLNFYRDIDRQEMYIRYLRKLCDLHIDGSNFTEAAYTLLLYTELLRWSDEPLDSMLKSDWFPSVQTHRELKDLLYHKIIDLFDNGKMWEKGIELCKELIKQYEDEVFDYQQLCDMLTKQRDLYDRILTEARQAPGYYRVSYYGNGFPSFLSNKTFVYRGREFEMLSEFSKRIEDQFPNAKVLRSLNQPSSELMESSDQYLQINAVQPLFEPNKRFMGKTVSEQILRYWKSNEIQRFTFSRPVEKTNDITKMWLERTNLTISSPLPGVLRWFPVIQQKLLKVSPLENAIETIEATNEKLQVLIDDHRSQAELKVDPLSMLLSGVVDPAVNGGISQYKVFFTGNPENNADEHIEKMRARKTESELVYKLKDVTTHQILLLRDGLYIHAQKCPESLRPFHDRMNDQFGKMVDLMQKEYGITPPASVLKKHQTAVNAISAVKGPSSANSESGSLTDSPKKPAPAGRSPSISIFSRPSMLREKSPSKNNVSRTNGRNSGRVPSGYSTDSKDSGDSGEKKPEASVIELRQELTAARPPRPDSKTVSRPNSGNVKQKLQPQLSLPSMLNSASMEVKGESFSTECTDDQVGAAVLQGDAAAAPVVSSPLVNGKLRGQSTSYGSLQAMHHHLTGHGIKWESAGNLPNALFDESSGLTSLLSNASSPALHTSSSCGKVSSIVPVPSSHAEPPPLPQKHSHADHSNTELQETRLSRVTMRSHSHRGKPPPALPTERSADPHEVPPPIPVKRSSNGTKMDQLDS